jgi:hypothetical protein
MLASRRFLFSRVSCLPTECIGFLTAAKKRKRPGEKGNPGPTTALMGIKAPAQGGEAGKGRPFIAYDVDETVKFNRLTCSTISLRLVFNINFL